MLSIVEKVLFLKAHDLFSMIPSGDLIAVAQISEELHFTEKHRIFKQGDIGESLYLIVEGNLEVIQADCVLAHLKNGEIFGEMALLDSENRSADIRTLTECVLLQLKRDDFYELLSQKTEIAFGIMQVLSRRQRKSMAKQTELLLEIEKMKSSLAK